MTERLLIVSNRLPVTAAVHDGEVQLSSSAGGLATGLRGAADGRDRLWIGWPGELRRLDARRQRELDRQLEANGLAAVYLNRREVQGFYESISNSVLWPVFHGLVDQLPLEMSGWDEFVRVNEKFAQVVADRYRPGDLIWIHDYQLILLPKMLRERIPDASIGFFLHIPFPPSETFGVLPWREEILQSLLGSDLIGFHTPGYLGQFTTALQRLLGVDVDIDRVQYGGRAIQLGTFPMGVDASAWNARAEEPDVLRRAYCAAVWPWNAFFLRMRRCPSNSGSSRSRCHRDSVWRRTRACAAASTNWWAGSTRPTAVRAPSPSIACTSRSPSTSFRSSTAPPTSCS